MIGAGQELGGYTIIKRIGGAGLGEVFLAQHRRVNRRAAVKVLLPELAQKQSVLEQFFKEARNTSLIRHPGIVEILDCDLVDGQPFVITEFLEGESLGAYLARVGTLEQDLAFLLGVMAAVADAVEAAHRAGIMHRDLKPENIYLHLQNPGDATVTVKVLDFGIAKLSREDGGPSQTKTGLWLATPTYMSPEQCRGVGRPDARSDVYALGCVFYQALCGRPPFEAPGIADLILAHLTQPPKPPIKQLPELPPKVNALVLRMLAKKPEERFQSMEQVVTAIRDCARGLGIDFEAQLLPLTPVERPLALLGAALAGVTPAKKPTGPLPVLSSPTLPPSPPIASPLAAPMPAPAPVPAAPAPAPTDPAPAARPIARTQVAGERGNLPAAVAPAPAAAPPSQPAAAPPRAFPRTLIAGAAERQAIAEGRLPDAPAASPAAAPPESTGGALVGGTMVLEPARPVEPARPAPARPAPSGPVHAQVGGTQILEKGSPLASRLSRPEVDDGDDDEDASGAAHAPTEHTMRVAAGGDGWPARLVPLLTGRAGLLVLGAAAVVALAIVMVHLLSGGPTPAARRPKPVEAELPAPPPAPVAAVAAPPTEERPPAPALPPPTVSIDIQGLAAETKVLVDDQPVTLPARVPRGPELHRFTLRPAHGPERTIEIDGTRDRVVELVMAPEEKAAHPTPRPAARPHPPARSRPNTKADSKIITDI